MSNCRCASGPFVPGVDGPLPEPLRERFNLTEEGAPKASPGRRNTKSLKLRKAAREKLRGPLVDAVEAAFKAGFEKQRAYVARRFRRLALIAGTPVEEVNPGEAEMVG